MRKGRTWRYAAALLAVLVGGNATSHTRPEANPPHDAVANKVTGFAGQAVRNHPLRNYDADSDTLIEIETLTQLHAIRFDPDGNGIPDTEPQTYAEAFPHDGSTIACGDRSCTGYELTASLDFDTNANGIADAGDAYWNDGAGWEPPMGFQATFDGNGNEIRHFYVNRPQEDKVGLFGEAGSQSTIRNVRLVDVNVTGGRQVGSLVGRLAGAVSNSSANGRLSNAAYAGGLVGVMPAGSRIVASYAAVTVVPHDGTVYAGGLVGSSAGSIMGSFADGDVTGEDVVGGLVGQLQSGGSLLACYARGAVAGRTKIGGLVGALTPNSTVRACYATGTLTVDPIFGADFGGLVGLAQATAEGAANVEVSYWDTETSGMATSAAGVGHTTAALQEPTGYVELYRAWNLDLDSDGSADNPWRFGTTAQYPVLANVSTGNTPPQWVGTLSDLTVHVGQGHETVDPAGKFLDPDRNDTLSYGATPSDPQVVMVDAVGSADRQSSTPNHAYVRNTGRSSTSTTVTVLPILIVEGGTLSVTWGQSLDTFATPLSADFAVRVNGKLRRASTIELREQGVILTQDPPVVAEDDVSVSYLDWAMHPVQYDDGRVVSAWFDVVAENRTGNAVELLPAGALARAA